MKSSAIRHECDWVQSNHRNKTIYDENAITILKKKPAIQFHNEETEIMWFKTDTGRMHCNWVAGPNVTVQWFKNGHEIEINDRVNYTDKYLEIESVTEDDAGEYECRVANKNGSDSIKTVISVINKSRIIDNIVNVETTTGSAVIFPCHYEIDESLTNVTVIWKYKYFHFDLDENRVVEDNNTLTIMSVKC